MAIDSKVVGTNIDEIYGQACDSFGRPLMQPR